MSKAGLGLGLLPVTKTFLVIDTSYLLELFAVPGNTQLQAAKAVQAKFAQAFNSNAQLFVPLPVLFELANHIADVKDGGARRKKALELVDAVNAWLAGEVPITIVSSMDDSRTVGDFCAALTALTKQYEKLVPSQHGLTDTAVVMEAQRLREKHKDNRLQNFKVHIWTRHQSLKALEPDAEPNPFV